MHEHDIRKSQIYSFEKDCAWDYNVVPQDGYHQPLEPELAEQVVRLYQEYAGGNLFNGYTVCLDDISEKINHKRTVTLSIGSFFDFLLCNVIGREASKSNDKIIRAFYASGASQEILDAVAYLGKRYSQEIKRVHNFNDAIHSVRLPGVIAVSILVHDDNGMCLLSKRTDNVIIGKRLGGVTATGTLEPKDLTLQERANFDDPFSACAARELSEETTFELPASCFKMRGFVIGKAKLQPIAIVDVRSPIALKKNFEVIDPEGGAMDAELYKLAAVDKSQLPRIIAQYDMTEASAYHLSLHEN